MDYRPKILLKRSRWDNFFEALSIALLLVLWVVALSSYSALPQIIPIHFNGKGQVDGFGNKTSLFSLPTVATIIYIGMTWLNQYPHIFNYSTTITPENAYSLYRTTTRVLRLLKLFIVLLFLVIVVVVVQTAQQDMKGPGPLFLPLLLTPLLVLAGWLLFSGWSRKGSV